MKNFKIAEPQTLGQVTGLSVEETKGAFLMAGGTDLLGEIKEGIISPDVVIDLKAVPALAYIKEDKSGVRIGAMTTVSEIARNPLIKQKYAGLYEAANSLATPQLRNVGTLGGNLCQRPRCWYYRDPLVVCRKKGGSSCFAFRGKNKYHAVIGGGICYIVHPSDMAPPLVALGADVAIQTSKGEKTVPLEEFFTLPRIDARRENILEPFQVLKEIKIPPAFPGEKSTYLKFKERGSWDFTVVSAAVKGAVSGGIFKDLRIVIGGVAPVPWRLNQAEDLIKGKKATEELVRDAARQAMKEARPLAHNAYKLDLVETILSRAVLALI